MTGIRKETLLGAVLLALGAGWTLVVWNTLSPGFGGGDIGPRAFPLAFGVLLIALSGLLIIRSLTREGETETVDPPLRLGPALKLLAEIVVYSILLEKIGFVLATPVLILAVMWINMGLRSPARLAGMALGMTLGCWLVFGKLLGIYLATGSWINLG